MFRLVICFSLTHHIDELWKFESQFDGQFFSVVGHRPDQSVVVVQEVVVQTFGVRVAHHWNENGKSKFKGNLKENFSGIDKVKWLLEKYSFSSKKIWFILLILRQENRWNEKYKNKNNWTIPSNCVSVKRETIKKCHLCKAFAWRATQKSNCYVLKEWIFNCHLLFLWN